MEKDIAKELVVQVVDEDQGCTKDEIICLLREKLTMTDAELDTVICDCLREKKIQQLDVGGKVGLYMVGHAKSNQAFYGDQSPKTVWNAKPLLFLFPVALVVAALLLNLQFAYFFVIALVVICIFLWIFRS